MKQFFGLTSFGAILFLSTTFLLPTPLAAATVNERVVRLEQQIEQMQQTAQFNNQRLAEALSRFESMANDMAAIRGEIEKIGHVSGEDMESRSEQLRSLEHRFARMEERLNDLNYAVQDLASISETAIATQQKDDPKNKAGKKKAEELAYQKAFSEMTQQRYKVAIKQFEAFLKKYPKGSLSDNAQYWKAECYFALGDYETAVLEFQDVIKRYPRGNKTAAAILKQAYSFVELKSYADAQAFLSKVIAEYPRSEEAVRAKEKKKEVDQLIREAAR